MAARERGNAESVIDEALRAHMVAASATASALLTDLPAARSGGTLPGVDLENMALARDLLDEGQSLDEVR